MWFNIITSTCPLLYLPRSLLINHTWLPLEQNKELGQTWKDGTSCILEI